MFILVKISAIDLQYWLWRPTVLGGSMFAVKRVLPERLTLSDVFLFPLDSLASFFWYDIVIIHQQ